MNSNYLSLTQDLVRRSLPQTARSMATSVKNWTTRPTPLAQIKLHPPHHYRLEHLLVAGCLLFLIMHSTLCAQNAPANRGSLNFRTMGWGVAPDDLFYSVGGKDIRVKIFDAGRSGFHGYPKRGEISFYRIVKKEDGTIERITMAQGDLSGTGPTPLLIITKSTTNPGKFDLTAIADDLTAFPERTCRFVNFTRIEIGVTVGSEAATVPPGDIRLVDTNLGEDSNTSYVTLFVKVTDRKLMLSYNNWVFRPGQRVMVFISVDQNGQPRVIRLIDSVASLTSLQATNGAR